MRQDTTHHVFLVEFRGKFPKDMLRYNRAVPLSYDDYLKVHSDVERGRDLVMLRSEDPPAYDRWESFGCRVRDEATETGIRSL